MSSKTKVQLKWEDMTKYAYIMLRHMPKSERCTLGAEIRASIWRGIRIIVRATHTRDPIQKQKMLLDIDYEIKTMLAMQRTHDSAKRAETYDNWRITICRFIRKDTR